MFITAYSQVKTAQMSINWWNMNKIHKFRNVYGKVCWKTHTNKALKKRQIVWTILHVLKKLNLSLNLSTNGNSRPRWCLYWQILRTFKEEIISILNKLSQEIEEHFPIHKVMIPEQAKDTKGWKVQTQKSYTKY